jgi:hypothetical protein
MKRALLGTLAAVSLAAAGVATISGTANADVVKPASCSSWHDKNTYGVKCSGGPYIAVAQCNNGYWVEGASASNNHWSYAYCSTVGSSYKVGSGYVLYQ